MEFLGRELLANGLKRALLYARDKDAHIFRAAPQLLLGVAGVLLELSCPVAILSH